MTIIEPNKNKLYSAEFLYLGLLLLLLAILSIRFYNSNVNLKFQISQQEREIQQLESTNADFRNQLYQILDPKNLSALIQNQNLISERNPEYLENRPLANL